MALLGVSFFTVLTLTLVTSKPICVSEAEDSSKSSESSESSEEMINHCGPSQDPLQTDFTGTDGSNPAEVNPMDTSTDTGPSQTPMFNTSALPDPEDPQTSTDPDAPLLLPDDPSQISLGVVLTRPIWEQNPQKTVHPDMVPNPEASLHPQLSEPRITTGADPPLATTTYQRSPQGVSPPFPASAKPTPLPLTTTPPLQVPIGTALTGVPVCFTLQLVTPEPQPVRGDNI